jgi:hypothetical protein
MATEPSTDSRRTLALLVALAVVLLVAAGWVSWLGIRGPRQALPESASEPRHLKGPVVRIELPHLDLELPPGPHRDRFQVACTVCHSPRLAFTQPGFPEKKWAEVVHKMVAVYGAPLSPTEEGEIVAYLAAVRGQ